MSDYTDQLKSTYGGILTALTAINFAKSHAEEAEQELEAEISEAKDQAKDDGEKWEDDEDWVEQRKRITAQRKFCEKIATLLEKVKGEMDSIKVKKGN